MKRALAFLLTLTMALTLLAGCGGSSNGSSAGSGVSSDGEPEPITLKLSMTATMDEIHGACWQTFKDYVEEKCPWITVEIYPSATLYDDSTFVDAIMRGNVEMGITAPGYLGEYADSASIFGACYIFKDADNMNAIMNGEIGAAFYDEVAEELGIRILGAIYKGVRTINLTTDKPVTSREDLNGVLLRVPNGESWLNMGYALGCTPTAMALSEVYLALQSGTIDGQDNPLQATMSYGFGEVTKSITMTNHIVDINWLCISEDIWQSLGEEAQAAFMEGFQLAYDESYNGYMEADAELIQQFRDMGVTVYDDVDMSTMQEEVWDYYWSHDEISGNWDKDIYDAIQAAAN